MVRPRKTTAGRKEKRITIRLTEGDFERVREQSETAGLSMAEFVRRAALWRKVVPRTDLLAINELRKLGGLLKQTHNVSGGIFARETARMLREIEDAIRKVARFDDRENSSGTSGRP